MNKWVIILLFSAFLGLTHPAYALYNPRDIPNNRFGIHIVDENDITDAAQLVNANGGDWGYIKLVIREDDRNLEKWQKVFNQIRSSHLIPIIRLATRVENAIWVKPRIEDIGSWVDFLASLNWVIENRYVIVFNEPNHAKEWGGELNPEEYGWYLKEFSRRLKDRSEDFFILPAGLDASAPDRYESMDELTFLRRMVKKEPDVFDFIDGWTSHSYPNPNFSGRPTGIGRGSIRTYEWELSQLAKFGKSHLPVFLTETGWKHNEGKHSYLSYPSPNLVGYFYKTAFQGAWNDSRLIAVTPFLLNYQDEPFDQFSWKRFQTNGFYPIYEQVQQLPKTAGQPRQQIRAQLYTEKLPAKLLTNSIYQFPIDVESTGQTEMGLSLGWSIEANYPQLPTSVDLIATVDPFVRTAAQVNITTTKQTGTFPYTLRLLYQGKVITAYSSTVTVVEPPKVILKSEVWWRKPASGRDFVLEINEPNGTNRINQLSLTFTHGKLILENLRDLIPGNFYKFILHKPGYLPATVETIFDDGSEIVFPVLLPFDPSGDGTFSLSDIRSFLAHPFTSLGLFLAL